MSTPHPSEILRSHRRYHGMTQAQLARVGSTADRPVSAYTVARWESGRKSIPVSVWEILADHWGYPPAQKPELAPPTDINPREKERRSTRAITVVLDEDAQLIWDAWRKQRINASARVCRLMKAFDASGAQEATR